jgi:RNA polymerase sigma-70 factor (ECF subfamily)
VSTNAERGETLLALYDEALPHVYGYLFHRVGEVALAEDLTSEVFLAAARSLGDGSPADPTLPWLIAVARNKLVDHWRRRASEDRRLRALHQEHATGGEVFRDATEEGRALETLRLLPAQYQAALALRYIDGLPVPEVAAELGRTLHATESLLARARAKFRTLYTEAGDV